MGPELFAILNSLRSGSPWIIILILIWIWFKYPDSPDKLLSFFCKMLARYSSKAEKKYISSDIQARVNSAASRINKESGDVLPFKLKVRFVRPNEDLRETFIKKDMAIIKMNTRLKQEENIAKAVHNFVTRTLVREARAYMDQHISVATDLHISHTVLLKSGFYTASSWFTQNIIQPILNKDPDMKVKKSDIEIIDSKGYFTRVFLRELLSLADKNPYVANPLLLCRLKQETGEFLDFLKEVAERLKGEEMPPLTYTKTNIKTDIILVSKPATAELGVGPYLRRFHIALEKQKCYRIYIVSSKPNLHFTQTVIRSIEKRFRRKARKISHETFQGISRAGKPIMMMIAGFESML